MDSNALTVVVTLLAIVTFTIYTAWQPYHKCKAGKACPHYQEPPQRFTPPPIDR